MSNGGDDECYISLDSKANVKKFMTDASEVGIRLWMPVASNGNIPPGSYSGMAAQLKSIKPLAFKGDVILRFDVHEHTEYTFGNDGSKFTSSKYNAVGTWPLFTTRDGSIGANTRGWALSGDATKLSADV